MAGLPGWQASVVSSQTDILPAAQMLGHAHAKVTARHYARAGEDAAERAAEALERELLQADNPVHLAKTGGAREEAGGPASRNTAKLQGTRGAHPEGSEPPTPGSEEERTAELTSTGRNPPARFSQ
jgi:hypothetical protein